MYRLIRHITWRSSSRTTSSTAPWLDLSCGQQKLVATGKQVVVNGWRPGAGRAEREGSADEDWRRPARSQVLPALRDGMACQVAGADIKALKTMPPKPYTQGELVKAMKGVARFVTDPRLKQKLKDTTASAPRRRGPTSSAG